MTNETRTGLASPLPCPVCGNPDIYYDGQDFRCDVRRGNGCGIKVGSSWEMWEEAVERWNALPRRAERSEDALRYWNERAVAAEEYISLSPCDPDITGEQREAYKAWQEVRDRAVEGP